MDGIIALDDGESIHKLDISDVWGWNEDILFFLPSMQLLVFSNESWVTYLVTTLVGLLERAWFNGIALLSVHQKQILHPKNLEKQILKLAIMTVKCSIHTSDITSTCWRVSLVFRVVVSYRKPVPTTRVDGNSRSSSTAAVSAVSTNAKNVSLLSYI